MKTTKSESQEQAQTQSKGADAEVEVLYQKMGDRWFAFSLVDDEVFVGSITQEEIDAAEKGKTYKISGNS